MDSVKDSIEALAASFGSRMAAFEKELHRVASPELTTVQVLAREFRNFRSAMVDALGDLHRIVDMLTIQYDNLEMKSRREMLVFHGIPEVKNEHCTIVAVKTIQERISLPEVQTSNIDRSHRLGQLIGDRPRPLLVKFKEPSVRDRVWFAKTKLKGSGITLSEFLTKPRHKIFMSARQRFGLARCWTWEGRVIVLGDDGKKHIVSCIADLDSVASKSSVAVDNKASDVTGAASAVSTVELKKSKRTLTKSTKR